MAPRSLVGERDATSVGSAAAQASGGPKEGARRAVRGESRRSSASRGARIGRRQPSERRGAARRRARSAPARITRAVGCAQALLRQTGSRWSARARGGRARVPTAPGGSCHAACPAAPAHAAVQARERLRHASQPIWPPRASRLVPKSHFVGNRLFHEDKPTEQLSSTQQLSPEDCAHPCTPRSEARLP